MPPNLESYKESIYKVFEVQVTLPLLFLKCNISKGLWQLLPHASPNKSYDASEIQVSVAWSLEHDDGLLGGAHGYSPDDEKFEGSCLTKMA